MFKERLFHCENCRTERRFRRDDIRHPVHALLTLATGGLWAISWISVCIGHRFEPWTCTVCDHDQTLPKEETKPSKEAAESSVKIESRSLETS